MRTSRSSHLSFRMISGLVLSIGACSVVIPQDAKSAEPAPAGDVPAWQAAMPPPVFEIDERHPETRMSPELTRDLGVGAAAGDARAMVRLGIAYECGEVVAVDHEKAYELYQSSALAGDMEHWRVSATKSSGESAAWTPNRLLQRAVSSWSTRLRVAVVRGKREIPAPIFAFFSITRFVRDSVFSSRSTPTA